MKTVVAVMAKRPQAGRTKTRLVPPLTEEYAAGLYANFLEDTITRLTARSDCDVVVALDSPASAAYFDAVAPAVPQVLQVGDALGDRLDAVLASCLALGFDAAVAIASDSPDLPDEHLDTALGLLAEDDTDIVLGPTDDGGYYLIGWKQAWSPVVTEVTMSTSSVLADTVAVAERVGARVALAPEWYDVDDGADLDRFTSTIDEDLTPNTARFLADRCARGQTPSATGVATTVGVVIPALNEEGNIGTVVAAIQAQGFDLVVVADNGSTDATAAEAGAAGAITVSEPRRGYGFACAAASQRALDGGADIVVYIDGDQSSRPTEIESLVAPIRSGVADLVLGSRVLGTIEQGAMGPHQRFGNWMTAAVMRRLYKVEVTDLGPFRAITADLLRSLDMKEMTFGWPTEMMVKAARRKAPIIEVPVSWDRRGSGESKVSGTIKGSALAAYHILRVTFRYSLGEVGR